MTVLVLSIDADRNQPPREHPLTAFANISRIGDGLPQLGIPVASDVQLTVGSPHRIAVLSLERGTYVVSASLPDGVNIVSTIELSDDDGQYELTLARPPLPDAQLERIGKASKRAESVKARPARVQSQDPKRKKQSRRALRVQEHKREGPKNPIVSDRAQRSGTITPFLTQQFHVSEPSDRRRFLDAFANAYSRRSMQFGLPSDGDSMRTWASFVAFDHDRKQAPIQMASERVGEYHAELRSSWDHRLFERSYRTVDQTVPVSYYLQRYVCATSNGNVEQIAVVPSDWNGSEMVASLRDTWSPQTNNWQLYVDLHDGEFASLLGYLFQDNLPHARKVIEQSLHGLWAKLQNPFAAAASGYLLMYSRLEDIPNRDWPTWIRNLAAWFPALPDGQILLATLYLQRKNALACIPGHENIDANERYGRAWAFLLRAMHAGVPLYSMGLRLLVENLEILSYLSEDGTVRLDGINEALRHARFLNSCLETSQPFTVLTVPRDGPAQGLPQ
jgi:hypothetical protein